MKRTVSRSYRLQDHAQLDYENIGSAIVYRCVHYAWPCMSVLTIVTKIGRRATMTEIVCICTCMRACGGEKKKLYCLLSFFSTGPDIWLLYSLADVLMTALEIFRLLNHTVKPSLYYLIFIIIASII